MWRNNLKTIISLLFFMLLLTVAYALLTGCARTVKKVTEVHDTVYVARHETDTLLREHSKTDTVYIVKTDTDHSVASTRDSILVRDSVFIRERGDTTYIYRERWRERLTLAHDTVYRLKADTVWRVRTDTVRALRFVERSDTSSHVAKEDNTIVKEKRSRGWKGALIGIFSAVALILLAKRIIKSYV